MGAKAMSFFWGCGFAILGMKYYSCHCEKWLRKDLQTPITHLLILLYQSIHHDSYFHYYNISLLSPPLSKHPFHR